MSAEFWRGVGTILWVVVFFWGSFQIAAPPQFEEKSETAFAAKDYYGNVLHVEAPHIGHLEIPPAPQGLPLSPERWEQIPNKPKQGAQESLL